MALDGKTDQEGAGHMRHFQDRVLVYKRCGCVDATSGRQLGRRCVRLDKEEHGSWYFGVQVRGPAGRRERFRRGGFATAGQAHHAGGEAIVADLDSGPGAGYTVARWLRCWLQTQQGLRPSTREGYADHIRLHLIPYLGRIELGAAPSEGVAELGFVVRAWLGEGSRPTV
ncbi:hypothetical protein FH608_043480 [Nonomuraea phyllanthi]|uniref:Integrase SAM-like N-terminal domain-containing protein n=1 Tax=Nonomuraea phyllanthi TaxID=2219224 RepID=A0A5C4VEN9_9ACTN|nr:hypothetical protein [Nonomuraea phyllanthi]KAB8188620.1 hypothetical protein FH608_043480 [Nonomuraea phyllanthi]